MPTRYQHWIGSRVETFRHGRLLIFISKRRQRSCGWSFPCQQRAAVSGASSHFCFIMWKSRETAENNRWSARNRAVFLRTHLSTGCPAASRRRVCGAGAVTHRCTRTNYLPRKRKQAPFAKNSWIGGCFLWGGKKNHAGLPALTSHPVFNKENTSHLFLVVSASVGGRELRVQFHIWLHSKSKSHRWGEKWLHVFTATDCVMSSAEMRFDFSAVLSVANGSLFTPGAVAPFAELLGTCCVIYILRESDESSSRSPPPFHFLFCCHVETADTDPGKCGPIFFALLSWYHFPALPPFSSLCLTRGDEASGMWSIKNEFLFLFFLPSVASTIMRRW